MTGAEIFLGLGIGIAVIVGAAVLSFVPWRVPWPRRHGMGGNTDYADGDVRPGSSFDAGGDGGGGD